MMHLRARPRLPHPLRASGRIGAHAAALAAATGLVLAALFVSAVGPAGPAARKGPQAAEAAGRGGGISPSEELAPPAWLQPAGGGVRVRSLEETPLWSGPDERAQVFSVLPAGSEVQPLGPYTAGRVLVYYAGDGAARAAGPAWVEARVLEPVSASTFAATTSAAEPALRPLPALSPRRVLETPPPLVTARHIAILDEGSGQLLYGQGATTRVAPASTTKIMTTLVALERFGGDLDRVIPISVNGAHMNATDGSSVMWLEPGERVRLETLLYGMMLPSGNDAAEQVALALGGTRERYVGWMNQRAAELGLRDTQFANPSGMDAAGHYSSAYDMALLARHAMRLEPFRRMAGAQQYAGDGYQLRNANRLVGWYTGADGVKIGFTDEARKTMVASASRGGQRVYVSIMRSEDLVSDPIALFEWVWRAYAWE